MSDNDTGVDSFFDVSGLPGEERDTDDPLVGTELDGRFRLERILGEGGMGKVYAGTQLSVGREVAVKLLRSEALVQGEVKARFLREAKLISGFNHPNIVRLIDYGEDSQRNIPYLVMELVRGVSLAELTRRGRLALPLALEICHQVCGALMQAHAAGIVHRDLKPENLKLLPVVGDSFQVKVLDFGIAFPRDANSRLTSTGMICGTSYYIAPEQARAWELDGRADLYALGIILFEMLSGHLPFRGDSDFQILLKQVQQPPPSLTRFVAPEEVPQAVVELVHDLLEKEPTARPETAREVRDRIDQIRRDCEVVPLDLDLEEASADAFEKWLLPRDANASLGDAPTGLDPSTPAEAIERLAADAPTASRPAETLREQPSQTTEDDAQAESTGASTAADDSTADASTADTRAGQPTEPSQPAAPRRRSWFIVAACVLLAAGAWAVWTQTDWLAEADSTGESPENAAASGGEDDGAGQASSAEQAIALDAFAGGCSVLGETDSWFHTVFLHPEVGEFLLWGDEKLVWSPVDVEERDGKQIRFNYTHPEREAPQSVHVKRSSSNKLVYRTDDTQKFVCRLEDEQRYFDTLEVEGLYTGADDDALTVEVSGSGQRLEMNQTAYIYRVLSGTNPADGVQLAVRAADDRKAAWALWELQAEEGAMRLERGDETTRLLTEERRRADEEKEKAKTTQKPKPPKKRPASVAKVPAPKPPPIPDSKESSSEKGASSKVVARYRKKIEALGDRCAKNIGKMKANIQHLEKLQEEKRYDELKEFSQTMQVENQHYSDMLREVGKEYSQLMTEITLSDMNRAQMVGLSSIYTNKCSWD